jgi:multimeric flavodoxin WrbA
MKVVAINGSPRKNGNTAILLKVVMDELNKEDIDTELIHLGVKPIQGCTACYRCFKNRDYKCAQERDIISECIEKMLEADGILLGSPTYFSDVTAGMRALIERCGSIARANRYPFKRKVGAGIIAFRRAGSIHAFNSLSLFFLFHMQMIIPGSFYWNVAIGIDPGDVQKDEEGLKTMVTLGQNMAWLLKKLHA